MPRTLLIPVKASSTDYTVEVTIPDAVATVTQGEPTFKATGATPIVIPLPGVELPSTGYVLPPRKPDVTGLPLNGAWMQDRIAGNVKQSTIAGRTALLFTVSPTQPEFASGRRSEVNLPIVKNKDPFEVVINIGYYPYSTNLLELAALPDVITQFHDPRDDPKWKSPFSVNVIADNWVVNYSNDKNIGGTAINLGKVVKDKWTDFVFHLKFSGSGNGLIEVWKDGVRVINQVVTMGYSGVDLAAFFKMGLYAWMWNSNNVPSQLPYVNSKGERKYGIDLKGLYYL